MDGKIARLVIRTPQFLVALALAAIVCGCGGSADAPAKSVSANTNGTNSSPKDPSVTEVRSTSPDDAGTQASSETISVESTPSPEASGKDPLLTNPELLKSAVKGYLVKSGNSYEIDSEIAEKLEALGSEGTDAIVPLLEDESLDVRRGAANYLIRSFDARRPEMVAGFQKLLSDPQRVLHGIALQAAIKMKPADQKTSVPALAQIVASEESESNRKASLAILRELGEDARAASDVVVQVATSDQSPSMRGAAMNAVPKIAETDMAVEALRKGLSDNEKSVQTVALAKLWAMEKDAAPAAKEVAKFFASDDKGLREKAIETLVRIGADSIPALVEQLADKAPRVREHALYTLGKMGSVSRPALPQIEKCFEDEDKRVREFAKVVAERITKGP